MKKTAKSEPGACQNGPLGNFLSRATVAKHLGVSTKTLAREVGRGALPRPAQLSAGRVGWRESVINEIMLARELSLKSRVTDKAKHEPTRLTVDEIAELLPDLMARHLAHQGVTAQADTLTIARQLSPAETHAATEQALSGFVATFHRLGPHETLIVAAALFPALRDDCLKTFAKFTGADVQLDDSDLLGVALSMLQRA